MKSASETVTGPFSPAAVTFAEPEAFSSDRPPALFDRALVVVTADHGVSFRTRDGRMPPRSHSPSSFSESLMSSATCS